MGTLLFLHIWTSTRLSILEKTGTENEEDPFNKISKITDMRPISIKIHEWMFANMVDQKRLVNHMAFIKKSLKLWNIGIWEIPKIKQVMC